MEEKKTSRSYMIGIIALMFMLIGYQTALFVHRAAVTSIAAVRDNPDTIYVVQQSASASSLLEDKLPGENYPKDKYPGDKYPEGKLLGNKHSEDKYSGDKHPGDKYSGDKYPGAKLSEKKYVKKNSGHSSVAQAVRKKMPHRVVESFIFNPNTVSVEDLCRLGFTLKQAESIDKYRKKGGRFRRKSDFAKSYVVSDSVYKRLEPYIDIPLLDLNIADSAALDALPGIGGWYASAIVKHRSALGGYSDKRQLMDIRGFNQERYDALQELVTVSDNHISPFRLWKLPADSLRKHPYIKTYAVAKAIVLYRENNPVNRLTVRGLLDAGVISDDIADKLSLCNIAPP